jgi:phosphoribosylformimino-5-aminoimidazole carboxamide ribotide isomerase
VRIVPVIDLMGGRVVRGVGGRRHEYQPIRSVLTDRTDPASLARAFVVLGLPQAYVADLDAIAGAEPDWQAYGRMAECGSELWIDAGLADGEHARRMASFAVAGAPLSGIVAGLESLPSAAVLAEILQAVGPARLIFSLDLKRGEPIVRAPQWQGSSAAQVASAAIDLGVRRLIVLDLAGVGMGQGVSTLALCRELRDANPDLEIIAGGGVRGVHDVRALQAAGCSAALVASALHDGRIGRVWGPGGELESK